MGNEQYGFRNETTLSKLTENPSGAETIEYYPGPGAVHSEGNSPLVANYPEHKGPARIMDRCVKNVHSDFSRPAAKKEYPPN